MHPAPDTPKVSVILPVFKARDYIADTIASLQRQTLRELEFIFVDDFGNDGTADIIEQAALSDPRIRFLRNPVNSGAGPSRNLGLANAKGEYVAFMDADDWVDDNFYERLYGLAHPAHLDFAKAAFIRHEEDGSTRLIPLNGAIRKGSANGRPLYQLFSYEHQSAIYARDFLQASGATYGTSRNAQDTTFLLRAIYSPPDAPAPSFALADNVAYHYRHVPSSISHSVSDIYFAEHVKSFREKIQFLAPRAAHDPSTYIYAARVFASALRRHYPKIRGDSSRTDCKIDFLAGLLNTLHLLPHSQQLLEQPALRAFLPILSIPWPLSDADRAALPEHVGQCLRPRPPRQRPARPPRPPRPPLLRRLFRRLTPKFLRRFLKAILRG